ncbi:6,7-dimethyl-8-ribityllumazine synthase [Candidatus Woesearchaeota archaeon]|nr:6,7-dimethyl-8-ribityllumazine synthase [Candidatus Woesearchaeota archaeon]
MNEKLGLVISEYNAEITHLMEKIAQEHAVFLGADVKRVIRVPGVFDVPLAVKKLVDSPDIDGVVTLGSVVEEDTAHDEIIAQNAARKIMDISVATGKPVSLGVSGPRMTRADGLKRIESYAKSATEAAVKMVQRLK